MRADLMDPRIRPLGLTFKKGDRAAEGVAGRAGRPRPLA